MPQPLTTQGPGTPASIAGAWVVWVRCGGGWVDSVRGGRRSSSSLAVQLHHPCDENRSYWVNIHEALDQRPPRLLISCSAMRTSPRAYDLATYKASYGQSCDRSIASVETDRSIGIPTAFDAEIIVLRCLGAPVDQKRRPARSSYMKIRLQQVPTRPSLGGNTKI